MKRAVAGKSKIDDDFLDNLEEVFITSDVGVPTTLKIIDRIQKRAARDKYVDTAELNALLRDEITEMLAENNNSDTGDFSVPADKKAIRHHGGRREWRRKNNNDWQTRLPIQESRKQSRAGRCRHIPRGCRRTVVDMGRARRSAGRQAANGVRPASVAFDTVSSAKASGADVVIIDTAGRLHNKVGLMKELSKIKNVMQKIVPDAPQEVLLVLDGSTGQNAFEQAKQFVAATEVNEIAITKLDGTAKGGVVIGISDQFKIPVKYIGLGEGMEDLQLFRKKEFVESLFSSQS